MGQINFCTVSNTREDMKNTNRDFELAPSEKIVVKAREENQFN